MRAKRKPSKTVRPAAPPVHALPTEPRSGDRLKFVTRERDMARDEVIQLREELGKLREEHGQIGRRLHEASQELSGLKHESERTSRYLGQSGRAVEVNPPGTLQRLQAWRDCATALSEFAPVQGRSYQTYVSLMTEEL